MLVVSTFTTMVIDVIIVNRVGIDVSARSLFVTEDLTTFTCPRTMAWRGVLKGPQRTPTNLRRALRYTRGTLWNSEEPREPFGCLQDSTEPLEAIGNTLANAGACPVTPSFPGNPSMQAHTQL